MKRLSKRLAELAAAAPKDPRGVPMSGAAGGLAGGLWAHFGAKLVPGAPYVLDALGFDEAMRAALFVVTGEGRLDRQSLAGQGGRRGGHPLPAVGRAVPGGGGLGGAGRRSRSGSSTWSGWRPRPPSPSSRPPERPSSPGPT